MENCKDTKAQKDGTDGLTKKERRALKVQAAGTNKAALNSTNIKGPVKHKIADSKPKVVDVVKETPDQKSHKTVPAKSESITNGEVLLEKSHSNKCVKGVNEVANSNSPSKSELRVQRRALQEAQRQAKVSSKQEQVKEKLDVHKVVPQSKPIRKSVSPKKEIVKTEKSQKHKVLLFNHLYFQKGDISKFLAGNISNTGVHGEFLKLGAQYASKTVLGSNARCLAMLSALKKLILDFSTPPKQEFCRSLEATVQICVSHINSCRPPAVSMTNALRHFKLHLSQINTNLPDNEKRGRLLECIETYIHDEIAKAGEAISMQVYTKISNGDMILIYGCSSLITKILLDAHREGKKFKVIVVDARPLLEGREMLRKLVCAGIHCTYILINATSFVMNRVSKVLLGAHALLANGYVMSRTGTAQVALIANAYKKPVLVCCETYKFCERVQTDSFVYNEIGDPDKLVGIDTLDGNSPLTNWQNSNYLTPINLMYDVTPPDLVTVVVTELAFLPCTSVPVILRIRPTEIMV